jgi:hypothetical protein
MPRIGKVKALYKWLLAALKWHDAPRAMGIFFHDQDYESLAFIQKEAHQKGEADAAD